MPLIHHELCFGCGRTNLFGLLLELEVTEAGLVAGRCFIKQDHQGPDRLSAHEGVVAAALGEALALARGPQARIGAIEVRFLAPAAVGSFLSLEADARDAYRATATATADGRTVATALGSYR
jgi:hypothetical protein